MTGIERCPYIRGEFISRKHNYLGHTIKVSYKNGSTAFSYRHAFPICVPANTFSFCRLSFILTCPEHVHLHQLGLPGKLEEDDSNFIQLRHMQTTLLQHLPAGTGGRGRKGMFTLRFPPIQLHRCFNLIRQQKKIKKLALVCMQMLSHTRTYGEVSGVGTMVPWYF